METIKIQKTKINAGDVWASPWGMNYRHEGRWECQGIGGGWTGTTNEVWLDAMFEVVKPLRTKEWEGYVFREDRMWKHLEGAEFEPLDNPNGALAGEYRLIAHYEGWDK